MSYKQRLTKEKCRHINLLNPDEPLNKNRKNLRVIGEISANPYPKQSVTVQQLEKH